MTLRCPTIARQSISGCATWNAELTRRAAPPSTSGARSSASRRTASFCSRANAIRRTSRCDWRANSRMSHRCAASRVSAFIQGAQIGEDGPAPVRIPQDPRLRELHAPVAEQRRELVLQVDQVEARGAARRLELDQQIDVALGKQLAARRGAEQRHFPDAVAPADLL